MAGLNVVGAAPVSSWNWDTCKGEEGDTPRAAAVAESQLEDVATSLEIVAGFTEASTTSWAVNVVDVSRNDVIERWLGSTFSCDDTSVITAARTAARTPGPDVLIVKFPVSTRANVYPVTFVVVVVAPLNGGAVLLTVVVVVTELVGPEVFPEEVEPDVTDDVGDPVASVVIVPLWVVLLVSTVVSVVVVPIVVVVTVTLVVKGVAAVVVVVVVVVGVVVVAVVVDVVVVVVGGGTSDSVRDGLYVNDTDVDTDGDVVRRSYAAQLYAPLPPTTTFDGTTAATGQFHRQPLGPTPHKLAEKYSV